VSVNSLPPQEELPPTSKSRYVLERLRRDIAEGRLQPGDPLRQADIAHRFGVSSTPVREALRHLEAEGAIAYVPHRGVTVAELAPTDVTDLYLLRARVEGLATRLATERMSDTQLDDIVSQHKRLCQLVKTAPAEELITLNRDLHFSIYRAAGTELLVTLIAGLWKLFPVRTNVALWRHEDIGQLFVEEHTELIAAMVARDAERADRIMGDHMLTALQNRELQGL
jgi:DNA-binding GntR family transcriptional regulator